MKTLRFGKVTQVTELDDMVLMPLSPIDNRTTHFFATIIYDLVKLGYTKKDFEFYFKDFLKKNKVESIVAWVEENNRMIWKSVDSSDEIIVKEDEK